MADVLALRTASSTGSGDPPLLRLDGAFLVEKLLPMLRARGFSHTITLSSASGGGAEGLVLVMPEPELGRLLSGRVWGTRGTVTAPAVVWRALLLAGGAPRAERRRPQPRRGR